jgi:hypothetical protein
VSSPHAPQPTYVDPNASRPEVPEFYRRPDEPQPVQHVAPASVPPLNDPAPTATDRLQTQAAPSWPANAPKLRPLMRLPFRERATAMRAFAEIQKELDGGAISAKGSQVGPEQAATMFDAMAKMDDFLASVAVDADLYRAWVGNASDDEFGQLFTAYVAWGSPGEAPSSSS